MTKNAYRYMNLKLALSERHLGQNFHYESWKTERKDNMYLTFLRAPGSYKSHFFIDVYLVRKADKETSCGI